MSRRNMQKTPKAYVAFGVDRTVISVPNQGEALVAAGVVLFLSGLVVIAIENQ